MAFALTVNTNEADKPILVSLTTTGTAAPVHEPGYRVNFQDGRQFMYVQHDSSGVAAVAGAPCVIGQTTTDDAFVVTADVSDGGAVAVGAFTSVLADTYYGWIQTKGFMKDVPSSGAQAAVSAGDPLYATDGVWKTATVGTHHIGAVAPEAGTGAIVNIILMNAL